MKTRARERRCDFGSRYGIVLSRTEQDRTREGYQAAGDVNKSRFKSVWRRCREEVRQQALCVANV